MLFGILVMVVVAILVGMFIATLVVGLIKALVRLFLAALITLIVGLLADLAGVSIEGVTLLALISFPLATIVLWKWLDPFSPPAGPESAVSDEPDVAEASAPALVAATIDPEFENAWKEIRDQFSSNRGEVPELAYHSCGRLLAFVDSPENDPTFVMTEQAALIRRHVPALASELRAALALSSNADAMDVIEQTRDSLEALGERSAELLKAEELSRREAILVRNSHLAGRMRTPGAARLDE